MPRLHEDARAQGGATCGGPSARRLRSALARRGEPTCGQPGPALRKPPTATHVRAAAPSPRPAQPNSAQREPDPGPGTARRRTGRLGLPRGGAAPVLFLPRGRPSPSPAPGGARCRRSRGTWARAPPLSPGGSRRSPGPQFAARAAPWTRRDELGKRRRRAQRGRGKPRDGRYRLRAHGALSAEPAGDLGECAWLPAPLLVHRPLSRPPAVAADPTRPAPGSPTFRGVLAGVSGWGRGPCPGVPRRFQLQSGAPAAGPRSAACPESGYTCSRRGTGLPVQERTGSERSPRPLWLYHSGKGLTSPAYPRVVFEPQTSR